MLDADGRGEPTLVERLELLRVKGARHRLAMIVALAELREDTGRLRGAGGIAMGILRAFSRGRVGGGIAGGLADGLANGLANSVAGWIGQLKRMRWLLPLLSSALSSKGSRRVMRALRGGLEAVTLGVFIYGLLRRFLRRRADRMASESADAAEQG